jgi:hypothetical protein
MTQSPMLLLWGAVVLSFVIIAILAGSLMSSCSVQVISRTEMIPSDTLVEKEPEKAEKASPAS